jgi:hypothetical protein
VHGESQSNEATRIDFPNELFARIVLQSLSVRGAS